MTAPTLKTVIVLLPDQRSIMVSVPAGATDAQMLQKAITMDYIATGSPWVHCLNCTGYFKIDPDQTMGSNFCSAWCASEYRLDLV